MTSIQGARNSMPAAIAITITKATPSPKPPCRAVRRKAMAEPLVGRITASVIRAARARQAIPASSRRCRPETWRSGRRGALIRKRWRDAARLTRPRRLRRDLMTGVGLRRWLRRMPAIVTRPSAQDQPGGLLVALDAGQRPQLVLDRGQARPLDRGHHLPHRLVGVLRLVDWDHSVEVDDHAFAAIDGVDLGLGERLAGRRPGHPPARAVVHGVAAGRRPGQGTQDEAAVPIGARDQDRVPGLLPGSAFERLMPAGKGAGGALAVDVHPAEVGVRLALDQVVTDLVDEAQRTLEDLLEGQSDLLEHGEAVDDGEVRAGGDGIEVVAVMPGVGREIAEIEGLDGRVLDSGEVEVIGRQPVAEAPAAGVHLDVKRVSGEVLLQLDEVVAAAEGAQLRHAPFGTPSASPGRQPVVGDRDHVALGVGAVHRGSVALYVIGGPAADDGFEFSPVEGLEAGAGGPAPPPRRPAGGPPAVAAPGV